MYRKETLTFLVLKALYELNDPWEDWVYPYQTIREHIGQNVPIRQLRKAMKVLRTNSHARYSRAFSEDDNLVNGSGHIITEEGKKIFQEIEAST